MRDEQTTKRFRAVTVMAGLFVTDVDICASSTKFPAITVMTRKFALFGMSDCW